LSNYAGRILWLDLVQEKQLDNLGQSPREPLKPYDDSEFEVKDNLALAVDAINTGAEVRPLICQVEGALRRALRAESHCYTKGIHFQIT